MTHVIPFVAAIGGNSKILWYLARATGIISMVLMGIIVLLGIATATKVTPKGFGKFLAPELHRRLSLTTVVFLGVHIVTAILDPFVKIGWAAVVIPFASKYRPLWLGLGTVAFDLLLVVVATSVIRHRFAHGTWKRIHYLSWAIVTLVLFHALGTGSDTQVKLVEIVYVAFIGALALAALFRANRDSALRHRQRTVAVLGVVGLPVLALGWAINGPLKPGWAKASSGFSVFPKVTGSSAILSASGSSGATATVPASFAWPVSSTVSGTVSSTTTSSGATSVTIKGLVGHSLDVVQVQLLGQVQDGSLALQSSSALIGTAADPGVYSGSVAQASGSTLLLGLTGPTGTVGAQLSLTISGSSFSGTIQAPVALQSGSESN